MTAPRDGNEVRAEQVAQAAEAVAEAQAAADRQQTQSGAWLDAGLPANPSITQPGSEQD